MITRRTRVQLLVFVIITLLGVTYVGARYARLDRLFISTQYTVIGHFAESGGIFAGGEVTYRGVRIGQVGKLQLTQDGVDVYMDIDNKWDDIPADSLAVVGNGSAVGEQYVELQPQSDSKPYLGDDSQIAQADTTTPLATNTLLTDIATTVNSVDKPSLRTTVTELGKAFEGTGPELSKIITTGGDFIDAADANLDTTTALIKDTNTVLDTQKDEEGNLRSFAKDLSLFGDTLVNHNPDLIRLIRTGSAGSNQLRSFIDKNKVDLGSLISELITTGKIVNEHLDGIKQVLVVYPYVVEGGFTVVAKTPETGLYDAHFGLILSTKAVCTQGYEGTVQRTPEQTANEPMATHAHCSEPISAGNARGAQNSPDPVAVNRAPVAYYDSSTGKVSWGAKVPDNALADTDTVAPKSLGEDSWKWLFLQPLTSGK